jgi:hypothetical protein
MSSVAAETSTWLVCTHELCSTRCRHRYFSSLFTAYPFEMGITDEKPHSHGKPPQEQIRFGICIKAARFGSTHDEVWRRRAAPHSAARQR